MFSAVLRSSIVCNVYVGRLWWWDWLTREIWYFSITCAWQRKSIAGRLQLYFPRSCFQLCLLHFFPHCSSVRCPVSSESLQTRVRMISGCLLLLMWELCDHRIASVLQKFPPPVIEAATIRGHWMLAQCFGFSGLPTCECAQTAAMWYLRVGSWKEISVRNQTGRPTRCWTTLV